MTTVDAAPATAGGREEADAEGVPCVLMRGGTSKGAYFLASDLPADPARRDALLLRIMGSPDPRQIDGLGGAHPLTSKVAVISASAAPDADVDYLFLQVGVDSAVVTDKQNCGNLLAGVGPFAIERGLVAAGDGETRVRIRMVNTGGLATATVRTPGGRVRYAGDTAVDGVPGTAAPVLLDFAAPERLLPSGRVRDRLDDGGDGVDGTLVDAGMPVVLLDAADFGVTCRESPADLEEYAGLAARLDRIRRSAAPLMGLDPDEAPTVPKLCLVAPPEHEGGTVSTRCFIPVRCHTAIGAIAGVSVGAGLLVEGAVGAGRARLPGGDGVGADGGAPLRIEHPTGHLDVAVALDPEAAEPRPVRAGVVRTARKIFEGTVFPGPDRAPAEAADPEHP